MNDNIIFGIFSFAMIILIWFNWIDYRTYKHRMLLLNRMSLIMRMDYFDYSNDRNEVSYSQHHWYIFTFRNSWKLYSNRIQELVK